MCTLLLYAHVAKADHIEVVTEVFPPYQLYNDKGELDGYATEVVRALFEITGDSANISVLPWARTYHTAVNNKNTMIYSLARSKIRDPLFAWVAPLNEERLFLWGLKSKFKTKANTLHELKRHIVALRKSSNPAQYLAARGFTNVHYLNTMEQQAGMLFKNRVDLLVADEPGIRARLENLNLDFNKLIKMYEVEELNTMLSIAFNLDSDTDLVERFQGAAKKLRKNGKLNELKQKWGIVH